MQVGSRVGEEAWKGMKVHGGVVGTLQFREDLRVDAGDCEFCCFPPTTPTPVSGYTLAF